MLIHYLRTKWRMLLVKSLSWSLRTIWTSLMNKLSKIWSSNQSYQIVTQWHFQCQNNVEMKLSTRCMKTKLAKAWRTPQRYVLIQGRAHAAWCSWDSSTSSSECSMCAGITTLCHTCLLCSSLESIIHIGQNNNNLKLVQLKKLWIKFMLKVILFLVLVEINFEMMVEWLLNKILKIDFQNQIISRAI